MLFIFEKVKKNFKKYLRVISYFSVRAFDEVVRFTEKTVFDINHGKRAFLLGTLSLFAAIGFAFGFLFCGAKIAYKVNYSGKEIAVVGNKSVVNEAVNTVVNKVNGNNVKSKVQPTKCQAVVILAPQTNTADEVADAIIENTDDFVLAAELYVNGKKKLTASAGEIKARLSQYLKSFDIDGATCSAEFVETVEVVEGYYLKTDIESSSPVESILSTLSVKTTAEFVTESAIDYNFVTLKDSSHCIGYRQVAVQGQEGVLQTSHKEVYVNGVLTDVSGNTTTVTREPIDQITVLGTSLDPDCEEETGSGFTFPLPSGSYEVSAYYGDGRGHKGMDFAASTGTPIVAAAGGRVVLSEWYSGYGYCVIVDHGAGVKTVYGHCSQLLCDVGDTVEAGELIALVGNTGDSTGPHLHFEIKINGSSVDPAPYMGY